MKLVILLLKYVANNTIFFKENKHSLGKNVDAVDRHGFCSLVHSLVKTFCSMAQISIGYRKQWTVNMQSNCNIHALHNNYA